MYLEELVLDGFKSYATRTVVGDWDPEFNAITGLNGSGKSNILDAICFVLGISTLAHDTSPPGYHDHDKITITRQIIIGGRNKYLVNGVNKNQQDVANLFQSVQLNINNPNFLIMQGKITKVLNMKPQEILNMIEEAAGTRMFEEHKEKAIKTMDKKDTRLDNISNLLETEVSSKLDKLRQEKRVLLEYQKIDAELGQLQRFVVAYDYLHANEKVVELTNSIETMGQHIKHLETMNSYLSEDIHELDGKICEIMEEKQKNGSKNSELDKLIKELAKNLVKMTTQHNLKLETIEDEQKNKQTLIESLSEIEANIEESIKKEAKLSSECASTLEQNERHVANTRKLEELLQNLTTGVSSSSGQDGGYMDQLRAAKQQVSSSVSKAQQTQLKITHITNELQDAIPKAKVAERQNGNIVNDLKISEGVIKMLQEQICSIAFDPKEEENLLKSRQSQQIRLDELDEAGFNWTTLFTILIYANNICFDRLLMNLKAPCLNFSFRTLIPRPTSIDSKSRGLLQNSSTFQKKILIVPLLWKFVLVASCTIAKSLAPGKVQLALDLVGSDEELAVVMDYVFGSTLVCKDTATAKLVTFDNGVRLRSVTYDGDTYDPSGQLSGGSKSSSSGALLRMLRLKDLKKQRADVNALIAKINADLNQCLRTKEILEGLQQSLDLKTHEQNSLENRLKNNPGMQIVQHVAQLQKTLTELQESMADCARCKSDGEKSIAEIAEGKRQILKAQPLVYKMQQDINVTKEETEQLRRDATQLQEQLKSIDELICSLVAECTQLEKLKISAEKEYQDGNAKLECEQSTHIICEKKLDLLQDEKRKKKQNIEDSKLELQTLVRDFSKLESEKSHFAHVATNLEKSHVWIQDKKKLFGKQDTEFDFQQHDMRECRKRLSQLNESHSKIQKSVDPQVLEKFDKVEKKETSLKQRLATVRKDRTKIQETIHTLDELKREKLIETWTKVNRDFGLIFGDLLPGNTCKLEASEGQDITEGLEIKVCLGGAWKQSLTELSGGQRSLIALSLILSLLQFKPAPMYILDEVDSALDLSHTQNIGQLLKSRFKGSQFIVVSLKDGMFNNANVLYRTKFVDGVSKVDRIASKEVRRVPLNATPGKLRTPAFLHTRRQSVLTEN
ncbi:hypothetical protein BDEG_22854 [Batrachochytrium dendrobatidis JEL423]|uniref:RecF/RecN/SMC N-terminal domain-containing protein n=1 Tax=Batrachochytrium dendrobatidis (strain JEL423) TaxID=403673 RepID=A0A177WH02_BATDL|nr:hypothetical protein BDEG_22854 [Batrachochytrium dendrobatidis JEL423]